MVAASVTIMVDPPSLPQIVEAHRSVRMFNVSHPIFCQFDHMGVRFRLSRVAQNGQQNKKHGQDTRSNILLVKAWPGELQMARLHM